MQEIAHPYAQGEQSVERHVTHSAQGEHALHYAAYGTLHLIIYGEPAQKHPQQHDSGNGAHGSDDVARCGEP